MRIGVIVFIKDDRKTGVASIPHCSYQGSVKADVIINNDVINGSY